MFEEEGVTVTNVTTRTSSTTPSNPGVQLATGNVYSIYDNDLNVTMYAYRLNSRFVLVDVAVCHKLFDLNTESDVLTISNDEQAITINSSETSDWAMQFNEDVTFTRTNDNFTYAPSYDQEKGFYLNALYYDSQNDVYLNTFGTKMYFTDKTYGIINTAVEYDDNVNCTISNSGETLTVTKNHVSGTYNLLPQGYFDN